MDLDIATIEEATEWLKKKMKIILDDFLVNKKKSNRNY